MASPTQGEEPTQVFSSDSMNAPWGLAARLTTVLSAIRFFHPTRVAESTRAIGDPPGQNAPPSLLDFARYLEQTNAFGGRQPNLLRVVQLLRSMTREGILQNFGSPAGKLGVFNDCFLFMSPPSGNPVRAAGRLWLAPVLGPEFLYHAVGGGVVQITGTTRKGDETAGTGIVVSAHTILTARHVVQDMQVHREQVFQGINCIYDADSVRAHHVEDVAFITVAETLQPIPGLVLHPPRVGQSVVMLGFPRVPLVRSAPLVMHTGEVTNESVTLCSGEKAFLYSATTRPGNSGGPIVSNDGYLLGLASKDLTMQAGEDWFAPHYAGVDAATIRRVEREMGLERKIGLPFEDPE